MKKVALIFGSIDSEHDVSIESALSVLQNFPKDRYECVPIYISKEGTWYSGDYTEDDLSHHRFEQGKSIYLRFDYKNPGFYCPETGENIEVDVAFLMLHGRMGEGGMIQGLLKAANIPFTGSDVLASALCMDKVYTHMLAEFHGIPMAAYQVVSDPDTIQYDRISYPCIVKPSREGSSFGVTFVDHEEDLKAACEFALSFDSKILIEDFIKGNEVGLAILEAESGRVISNIDQINVDGTVFDFNAKYKDSKTEILGQSTFPLEVQEKVRVLGDQIFDILDCKGFARIDFFVDESLNIYFNEINTIPGFTSHSRYPTMMNNAGYPYSQVIAEFIDAALRG